MNTELIPVLNIEWSSLKIARPKEWPYWDYPSIWNAYNKKCQLEKEYKHELSPYLAGSTFYELSQISTENLKTFTKEWSYKLTTGEYNYEEGLSLPGGYVLRQNNKDIFFPQCCGELSCISYWERISQGQESSYYEGHPAPTIKIKGLEVLFDFTQDKYDDPFLPQPLELKVLVNLAELRNAVIKAKQELVKFEKRLETINENIGLKEIGRTLIWYNPNYK